ncbi:response regulator transcription factor [Geosporobacter ferrireducens]|uniref:Stage 0 sporulation protein A homolog n=1 Tax=Geosporobacter ferrireducens TaxID=1424294 RepID=A0A1D8GFQ2_9FIRM|nr:response regulator transcription factor [Geosporobacter ferrireducens]AOT69737.1 DNA-binding response regulator [Geosporobacter ferrireducens]MTI54553.1 response regulator transcription factor [Geosporobacter ferrireducens]
MNEARILVVDDEEKMRHVIQLYLSKEGYAIETAANGREALEKVDEGKYDLILLDVMMPEIDGWTVCRKIRQESTIPIILLTARGEEYEKIFGFDLGADDYLTKPFSLKEMAVRVRAVLKRYLEPNGKQQKDIKAGALQIKAMYKQVLLESQEVLLTPKEYELLYFLARSPQIVYSREQLLNHVWGYDFIGDARTVDTHIKQLREKLGEYKKYIQTVWGTGYKFKVGYENEKHTE